MAIKKGKSTPINYAALSRNLAEKILKDFGSQEGETRNEPDELVLLPTKLRLKKRLDELSLSTFAINKMFKEVERHNRELPAGCKKVVIKANKAWVEVYNKARSILNEAADAGIELSSVPAGDGSASSFKLLQSWIDESLYKISIPQKHIPEPASGDKAGDTPVTLREFMRCYCESLSDTLLESRAKSLLGLHQRGKIKLNHIKPYKQGQSKKFRPSYLIEMWPSYRKKLQTLPNLKQTPL